jgi:hypothetical protein
MKLPSILGLGLLLLAPACRSTPPEKKLESMVADLHAEIGTGAIHASRNDDWWKRQSARLATVRQMLEEQRITSALDHFYAAVILVETDSETDLANAHELGLKAAELGETRGFRVAAEALDKLCVKLQLAQKYGTQYVYEPVIKAWRLYPVDPKTSDAERVAMGVEPMEKLLARLVELNRGMPGEKKP